MIPRIAICVPTRDSCATEFTQSLARMVGHFSQHYVARNIAELVHLFDMGTLLPDMRNTLVKTALKTGATHILWLDSDMLFPHDTLERLLKTSIDQDLPIIAANYSQRKRPAKPVAAKNGHWLYTEEGSTGLEEVDYVGSGVMLVEALVYEHLEMPWYSLAWHAETARMVGEDVYFCRKAARIGAKTFVDHDLSKEILHVGVHNYDWRGPVEDRPLLLSTQVSEENVKEEAPAKEEAPSESE